MQEIFQVALDLDGDFQAWDAKIAPAWDYRMTPNTPEARAAYDAKLQNLFLAGRGAPPEIHAYASLKRCWIWGFYRTTRMFLLRDLLEMINWLLRFPEPDLPGAPMSGHGPTPTQKQYIPAVLTTRNLCMRHSMATTHLVEVIEKTCSALIGSFTVPIHLKSFDDVVGMRGYVCIWPLGIMDSVLSSRLVPDINGSKSPQSSTHSPPANFSPSPTMQSSPEPFQSNISSGIKDAYAEAPPFTELSHIIQKSESDQFSDASNRPVKSTPLLDVKAKKNHVFDSNPPHPYDLLLDIPYLDYNIPEPKKMDVPARREWINRLMYYAGVELGLKKALYVPFTEGFMPIVKPSVDYILGR